MINNKYTKRQPSKKEVKAQIKEEKNALILRNLAIIEAICKYLDENITSAEYAGEYRKATTIDILNMLAVKGYNAESTKPIMQHNYILIDLGNAQINKFVTGYKINIRVEYAIERLLTSFYTHQEIVDRIVGECPNLFKISMDEEEAQQVFNDLVIESTNEEAN